MKDTYDIDVKLRRYSKNRKLLKRGSDTLALTS